MISFFLAKQIFSRFGSTRKSSPDRTEEITIGKRDSLIDGQRDVVQEVNLQLRNAGFLPVVHLRCLHTHGLLKITLGEELFIDQLLTLGGGEDNWKDT